MRARQRIVLVEDDPALCMILGHNLRARGYQVAQATTGAAGLAALADAPSALLLLDVHLPDTTGWEVLRHLPAGVPRQLPAIVFSATAPDPEQLREFAWIAFLHKPFALDTLLHLIAERLARPEAILVARAGTPTDVPSG